MRRACGVWDMQGCSHERSNKRYMREQTQTLNPVARGPGGASQREMIPRLDDTLIQLSHSLREHISGCSPGSRRSKSSACSCRRLPVRRRGVNQLNQQALKQPWPVVVHGKGAGALLANLTPSSVEVEEGAEVASAQGTGLSRSTQPVCCVCQDSSIMF